MSPEAQERFTRWHARQRELGACRCAECREAYPNPTQKPATLVGMEEMDRPTVHLEAAVDQVLHAVESATDAELEEALASRVEQGMAAAFGGRPPVLNALQSFEARKKAAMGGGGYTNAEVPPQVQANLDSLHQALCHSRYTADLARSDAVVEKRQAEAARLTYEQARARLEAEFGAEQVGKSIAALEKLLSFRGEFDRIATKLDEAVDSVSSLRRDAADAEDDIEDVQDSLTALREKLNE